MLVCPVFGLMYGILNQETKKVTHTHTHTRFPGMGKKQGS